MLAENEANDDDEAAGEDDDDEADDARTVEDEADDKVVSLNPDEADAALQAEALSQHW